MKRHLLSVAILVGVGLAGARYLRGDEVLRALKSFDYGLAPLVLGLSAVYLVMQSFRFVLLMRPVSKLLDHVIIRGYLAGQAATLLPGGVAARAGLMRQAGDSLGASAVPVALSSFLDQSIFLLCGLGAAAVGYEQARKPALIALGVLLLAAGLLAVPGIRRRFWGAVRWAACRVKMEKACDDFAAALPEVATPQRLLTALAMTGLAFFLQLVILALCMDGVGHSVPYSRLFVALVLPTMLGRLSPTPGGVGVTEAGMIGFLTAAGVGTNTAAAAVAIFRIATILFQALLGALVYFLAWDGKGERRHLPFRRRVREAA